MRHRDVGPCVTRINNAAGNQITNAIVLKNQNVGRSWNFAAQRLKTLQARLCVQERLQLRRVEEHGRSGLDRRPARGNSNAISGRPEQPGAGVSRATRPGTASSSPARTRSSTSASARRPSRRSGRARTIGNTSYVFAGDMNGDGGSGNDLIYIPRDQSEMNFAAVHRPAARTFTAGRAGGGVRGLHPAGPVPEQAPRPVRRARRRVPADGQADGPERHPGRLRQRSTASGTPARSASTSPTSATC